LVLQNSPCGRSAFQALPSAPEAVLQIRRSGLPERPNMLQLPGFLLQVSPSMLQVRGRMLQISGCGWPPSVYLQHAPKGVLQISQEMLQVGPNLQHISRILLQI
jgi:hypothetical protein